MQTLGIVCLMFGVIIVSATVTLEFLDRMYKAEDRLVREYFPDDQ